MKLYSVQSNMIEAVGYDPDSYILQVVYVGGRVYNYEQVAPDVWDALTQAESIGSFIMQYIVDVYPESEV